MVVMAWMHSDSVMGAGTPLAESCRPCVTAFISRSRPRELRFCPIIWPIVLEIFTISGCSFSSAASRASGSKKKHITSLVKLYCTVLGEFFPVEKIGGGRFLLVDRISSSCNWASATEEGQSTKRSVAFCVFGKAITSRIEVEFVSSMASRSRPKAIPP